MTLLLVSPEDLIPTEIVFLTYKLMIISLINQPGTPSQQCSTILPLNKVHHRAAPEAYGALDQPPHN